MESPPVPEQKRVKIICPFLRGRSQPKYMPGTSQVIFEKGQILYRTEIDPVVENGKDYVIVWIQVEVPNCPCCHVWVSSNAKYVREV